MSEATLILSSKFKRFMKYNNATREFLEGQTSAGKTTVGAVKFIFKVLNSKKRQHFIAGLDIGTLVKNIVTADLGLLDIFEGMLYYYPSKHKEETLPHLIIKNKIIYLFGYNDVNRWKKALGGQFGCGLIDEFNIANIEFVREATMRTDYLMATLNPDDPNLPIYSEFVNHSRPLKEYANDLPQEMSSQLQSQEAYDNWVHWFFTMDDNAALSEAKKQQIKQSVPVGSKLYKNKILGIRGRAEGLVFTCFSREHNVIDIDKFKWLPNEYVTRIIIGMDSGLNVDATAVIPMMLTTAGRILCMPSFYYEPKLGSNASSQQAQAIARYLDYWFVKFGLSSSRAIIVGDSAALTQTVIYELNLNTHYRAMAVPSKDIQKDTQRAIGMFEKDNYCYIINAGRINPITFEKEGDTDMFIVELENKVWDKKKNVPEDGNDHCIDAFKYGSYVIYYGGAY